MKTALFVFILSFLIISCSQESDVTKALNKASLSQPRQYNVVETKSDWGIGEGTENYCLIISKNDYQQIVHEIKGKRFFKHLDTAKQPIYALGLETDAQKVNETACWYDNKFFYQIFNPNPGFTVTIVLEKDSLMYVSYNDL